jgi:hypothetical protein
MDDDFFVGGLLLLVGAVTTVGGTYMWQGIWPAVAAGSLVFFLVGLGLVGAGLRR